MEQGRCWVAKVIILASLQFLLLWASAAFAEEQGCQMCHPDLIKGKSVHAAVSMGCEVCHTGVDTSQVPHAFISGIRKGLSADSPDLCFSCHDKSAIVGKPVVHTPVEAGMCTGCHNPHSSENEHLLVNEGNALCLGCHAGVAESPHVTSGHPLEGGDDPVRKGQPFGCVSCHRPHSSEWPTLFRYEAADSFTFCTNCHLR